MCENQRQPLLVLRGLCSTSKLDKIYLPHNPDNSGKLRYVGLYGTLIEYNKVEWITSVVPGLDGAAVSFAVPLGVFHGVAGVARITPGLMELPSTGKGIEVSR